MTEGKYDIFLFLNVENVGKLVSKNKLIRRKDFNRNVNI